MCCGADPQIDKSRIGITGGSYGGFMTNWIIGHTHRFAAAASQRSISNWISMEGTSDIGPYFGLDQAGGNAWERQDQAWWHSPLKYADKCTTPTLFIHSDEDYRCWMVEALQACSQRSRFTASSRGSACSMARTTSSPAPASPSTASAVSRRSPTGLTIILKNKKVKKTSRVIFSRGLNVILPSTNYLQQYLRR